jgi:predicted Zn-dependent peptidase
MPFYFLIAFLCKEVSMYNLFKLNNGLRIVLEEIDYVNSVSVGLWVENGSRNETLENNGISHFIEHMLFKGTKNRSALELVECIEDVGGQINAFTGKEATCFYVKLLATHIELGIDVIADMLFNSQFSPEDIEKEKGVIIEEINMNEDSPEDVLSDLHSKAAWGEDSLSLPILGSIESVKRFTQNDLLNFLEKHYTPENSVISIAGKFNSKALEKLLIKYFGEWKNENNIINKYTKPEFLQGNLFRQKKIEQLHINLGLKGLQSGDEDIYGLLLLNNIFGGGASSILFQKIREEKGVCYSIYSYISAFNRTGIMTIYIGLNPSFAVEVVSLIKDEVNNFVKNNIQPEKLFKAKEQLKGNFILGLESTSSIMFNNGKSVLFLNRINIPEEVIKKIDIIDAQKINEVLEKTFSYGIQNSAYVGDNVDLNLIDNVLEPETIAFKTSKSNLI